MLPMVIVILFFAALAIGSLAANALGMLPTATESQDEDRVRFERYQRSL